VEGELSLYRVLGSLTSQPLAVVVAALMRTDRFFDIINTPIAALSVLFVVVAVNVFLYFGYYSAKTPTPLPTERSVPSATTLESTERAGPKQRTLPQRTRPATTLQSTTPTEPSATVSATVSATASPSP
jgi:hypothetical protein